jgi:hypothetical protein
MIKTHGGFLGGGRLNVATDFISMGISSLPEAII